ncbi:hypothetical protein LSAT2_000184 [Lamellibrachia satsuma]|nr:hypothetical protein LSAT2_000184 [Lamellibrachia satsuma]
MLIRLSFSNCLSTASCTWCARDGDTYCTAKESCTEFDEGVVLWIVLLPVSISMLGLTFIYFRWFRPRQPIEPTGSQPSQSVEPNNTGSQPLYPVQPIDNGTQPSQSVQLTETGSCTNNAFEMKAVRPPPVAPPYGEDLPPRYSSLS